MDRADQLGRLRVWTADHDECLRGLLTSDWVLYGEWLWLRHGAFYDALPDWLVVLDLCHSSAGFAPVDERDQRAAHAGLVVPPRRFQGGLGSNTALQSLFGPSSYSRSGRAEGLVLRHKDGRRCKVVDPHYRRRTDEDWDDRQHNSLASPVG